MGAMDRAAGYLQTARANSASVKNDIEQAVRALEVEAVDQANRNRSVKQALDRALGEVAAMRSEMNTVFAALERVNLHPSLGNLPRTTDRSAFLAAQRRVEAIAQQLQAAERLL